MPLIPGTILGQYEIRAPLGAGGMGEVYRARDARLGRDVAIKVLPESLTSDPQRLQRFEQEARAAAALNHPNILAVYQMSTHEGGISYLVTELLEGETLRDRLRRGPVPLRKTIDYAVQIAQGLAAPHEKGIVHRDLKPDNLFVTRDDRIKILDFGLAKIEPDQARQLDSDATLTRGTDPGVVMGTVGYMSPEQVRGKSADYRSDIFAFGTILYEMITGRQTFHKPTTAETMTAILNEDPPSISQLAPDVAPALQRIVHRCLEKNPEQRFQSAKDLAFALEALSDSSITPVSGTRVLGPGARVHGRMTIVAAGLVIAGLAAILTYYFTRPIESPKVANFVQLTHDGETKTLVGTDGVRLYLNAFKTAGAVLSEMSVAGGDTRTLTIFPTPNMGALALSPDGSQMLAVDAMAIPPRGPLWSVPVLGGAPRRLGNLEGHDGSWSADGKLLAFTDGSSLFVASGDGSEPRKITTIPGQTVLFAPAWSPDGKTLSFSARRGMDTPARMWEVGVDGSQLREILPGAFDPGVSVCCGRWTTNGHYFVFAAGGQIWVKRGDDRAARETSPIRLTSSLLALTSWVPSTDGKKLFVVGETVRGELVRYDTKSGHFLPFLGGISAEYLDFSRDGQWVSYITFPEGRLWRSKADGSERLQLTSGPGYAMMPRWSPDGKTIAFYETYENRPPRMFTIGRDGGTATALLPNDTSAQQDPNWSPDGSKIVFGSGSIDPSGQIRLLDLATHQVTTVPGSQGLFSPRWSRDGRFIPALSADSTAIMMFDQKTQKWSALAKGTYGWLNWSKDGQSLIVLDQGAIGAVLNIRLDGKIETVVDIRSFNPTGRYNGSLSVDPEGAPIGLRNAGTDDVYALEWTAP